jgi:Tol biopolymer transport system component/LysM repeat protein
MNLAEIDNIERRYQVLVNDFQAGKIGEEKFVSEVDDLQFQDEWGRYWMMGAQTGAWHYYDGQSWHQADPRDADKLPFMDELGRYWQRGTSSGDWYYYDAETEEWVKPDQRDAPTPTADRVERPSAAPYQSHLRPQSAASGPDMPSQLDGELFQDDEGRYWMVGAKTGQWYFFDYDGWHPAHEFQTRVASQPWQSRPYQTQSFQYGQSAYPAYAAPQTQMPHQPPQTPQQAQGYAAQPYQPQVPQPAPAYDSQPQQPTQQPAPAPQPTQGQATTPRQETQAPSTPDAQRETPAEPIPAKPDVSEMPSPPSGKSDTGAWYYFDGKQWLKYSSGEPADIPPPDSEMILDQKAEPAKARTETKEEKPTREEPVVVAELYEEDEEPPAEVVDVEVITVIEAEPDIKPEAAPSPEPPPEPVPSTATEDVARPRRVRRPTDTQPTTSIEPRRQPKERTSSDSRPVAPRKRESAHEPTIIIPTESAASSISSGRTTRPVKPGQFQQRRARENTIPMENVAAPAGQVHRGVGVTQPLPKAPRSDMAQVKVARAREDTKEDMVSTPRAAAPTPAQPQKAGYTFGDVLRAFPSTFWTLAIGLIVLLVFAFIIVVIGYSTLRDNSFGVTSVELDFTPTLPVAMANATPTPGPTPPATPEPIFTPAPVEMETFSSNLGFALEYPSNWQKKEETLQVVFSPSADGLDPDNLKDTSFWIGMPSDDDSDITNILADVLASFPVDAETSRKGTISIASQTWTSAQIEFEDEKLGGRGIATLAVTNKGGQGYFLVAVAPLAEWNSVQPLFQEMIGSLRFVEAIAETIPTPIETSEGSDAEGEEITPEASEGTPSANTTPAAQATPVTYIVQSGDTLLDIAVQFGVDADRLASENGIDDPNELRVGQELTIPFTDEELEAYISGGGAVDTGPAEGAEGTEETTSPETAAETEATPAPPSAPAEAAPVSGRIVYPTFNPGTNNYDVWLVDLASGQQSVIAGEASQAAFNKDGTLLAYRSWNLATRGIFFRDFIGGRGGQVTRFVEDGLPTWAPDGFSFAFASRREGDRVPRIYRGDQLGQNDYSIGFQGEYPSTFPDGRLIVKGCLPTGDCGLYIIGANGGGETKISGETADTAPAVSPDGSKIAFMSSARGATNWEIWVMNADGSNPQRLTDNGSNDGLPTWSPDGQSIAFVSDQGGVWAVWAMNPDGSNQRKLFNMNGSPDGKVLHAGEDSRGWLEERISWAP